MDPVKQLQRQYVRFVKSLYREGTVDGQFIHMQKMQDVDAEFLTNTVNVFYNTSERILHQIDMAFELKIIDADVKQNVHRIKGGSMSIGARKLNDLCIAFRDQYDTGNHDRCLQFLPQIKEEYHLVKSKLQTLFSLQQQILGAGGSIPILGR